VCPVPDRPAHERPEPDSSSPPKRPRP
jgi:hypothetical protein